MPDSAPSRGVSGRSWLREPPERAAASWTAFRQTDADLTYPVFWRPGSVARPSPQESGRWHVRGEGYAQYLALSEEAAWAEFIRAAEICDEQEAAKRRRRLWVARVHEVDIADLSTPSRADACGLDPPTLVGPHKACREIARELHAAGFRGVLAPSAALEGHVSLTLFGPRIDEHLNPFAPFSADPPDRDIIEVKALRGVASPPGDLVDRVRRKGTMAYDTWPEEGDQFSPTAGT